jgi:hypothetical protein
MKRRILSALVFSVMVAIGVYAMLRWPARNAVAAAPQISEADLEQALTAIANRGISIPVNVVNGTVPVPKNKPVSVNGTVTVDKINQGITVTAVSRCDDKANLVTVGYDVGGNFPETGPTFSYGGAVKRPFVVKAVDSSGVTLITDNKGNFNFRSPQDAIGMMISGTATQLKLTGPSLITVCNLQ